MLPPSPWWVYILYSVSSGRLYTGTAKDPQFRLTRHNAGKGARSTRFGRPWIIVYMEPAETNANALRRGRAIKKLSREYQLILAGLAA